MHSFWHQTILRDWLYRCIFVFAVAGFGSQISAADVRLKNGTILHGNLQVMDSLSGQAVGLGAFNQGGNGNIELRHIARIDTGWQRIHFPVLQNSNTTANLATAKFDKILIPRSKRQGGHQTVTSFGSILSAEPFDEWGRRLLTIRTQKDPNMPVYQAITEVMPDHVLVESTNCDWKLGLALKSIPPDSLDKLIRRQFKQDDQGARFALARFYMQAQFYPQAILELEGLARDFPDKQALIQKTQADLLNSFGAEILRILEKRKRAGQHVSAEAYAKILMKEQIGGTVGQDVLKYIQSYEQARQSIERVKLLLGDWQAKLNNAEQEKLLQPLRSELNEQLDFETLPRLDTFLKAEDQEYDPSQRLGLAYSGWVLGAANAIPDLEKAIRVWDARKIVIECLRTDDPAQQLQLAKKLQPMESISPEIILFMMAQLPPLLDASNVELVAPYRVDTEPDKKNSYWVRLPAEYSPHHQYPLVVVLRPNHRSSEQTVSAWAGNVNDPELGNQRGYIVIAPEYADRTVVEYNFGANSHECVLDCLIDARKRFSVDSDRVFLAGHGMGADAAFDIGMAHADEFAGVIPMGGNAVNYCNFIWENGSHTAWYVIGKGYDTEGNRDPTSNVVFDRMFVRGAKFDLMLVEYQGRNGENVIDELPRVFDWMDLPVHVRPAPPKQFKFKTLRKSDNRFFCYTGSGFPHDFILPAPAGVQKPIAMEVEINFTPGNTIFVKSPTENYSLRLYPELIDFEKRIVVKRGNKVDLSNQFVKPDIGVILDELRLRGDRKRLPLAVLTP